MSSKPSSIPLIPSVSQSLDVSALPLPPEHMDASPRSNGFWGMAVFLVTDTVIFLLLLVANIYLRRYSQGPAQGALDPGTTIWFSLGLWASSGALVLADSFRKQAKVSGLLYLLTAALGFVFLYGQAQEYLKLNAQGATVDADLFFTGFYTLTGLHGLHVAFGALALLVTGVLRFRGLLDGRREGFTAALGLYWHFVDAVWVVLFLLLYVWGGP
ncbi:heme-copper oxidase subunit III [Deinococcus sp. AJ005]|uniref:cytochrome c oxidase subunit 3 n=1 Tax=Deinococcus sp. AJ005 TaxID=2652443 RepID=UPI001CF67889|nr:heme-copper oxidase subunit III [Deinococcus sp. AJ005]